MPSGIQCFNAQGQIKFDTNTITSRPLGQTTLAPGQIVNISVPISSGKQLWYIAYASGKITGGASQTGPASINIEAIDMGDASARLFVIYGEH